MKRRTAIMNVAVDALSGGRIRRIVLMALVACSSLLSSEAVAQKVTNPTSSPEHARFTFGSPQREFSIASVDVYVPDTLYCYTDVSWFGTFLTANENIFSPSSRFLGSHTGYAYNSLYDEAVVNVDEWSRPGFYRCQANWAAYSGTQQVGGDSTNQLWVNVINDNCQCMNGGQNRAITRTSHLFFANADPNLPSFIWDSFAVGGEYWNRTLADAGASIRIGLGSGIPVITANIADLDVPARYTNEGGWERVEWDPEFFGLGWDPLIWDHLATHEMGHALGFLHAGCGQTISVMYASVNYNDPANAIGRFSPTTNTDRCYIYSEYRP